jgi:hypothetical protein
VSICSGADGKLWRNLKFCSFSMAIYKITAISICTENVRAHNSLSGAGNLRNENETFRKLCKSPSTSHTNCHQRISIAKEAISVSKTISMKTFFFLK